MLLQVIFQQTVVLKSFLAMLAPKRFLFCVYTLMDTKRVRNGKPFIAYVANVLPVFWIFMRFHVFPHASPVMQVIVNHSFTHGQSSATCFALIFRKFRMEVLALHGKKYGSYKYPVFCTFDRKLCSFCRNSPNAITFCAGLVNPLH